MSVETRSRPEITNEVETERDAVASWDDAHRYTPAPRHRRRLLLKEMGELYFHDVLDAGCAQPFLLKEIVARFNVSGFGCDVSECVLEENRRIAPDCEFRALDLSREVWPGGRTFDLVVCSEVLEHIDCWKDALANVVRMARDEILITVPAGPLRAMDKRVGHHRHFAGPELVKALEALGCRVDPVEFWGWPVHSAYKAAISRVAPDRLYDAFSGGMKYGLGKKIASELLYRAFYLNDLFNKGNQIIIHAKVPRRGASK